MYSFLFIEAVKVNMTTNQQEISNSIIMVLYIRLVLCENTNFVNAVKKMPQIFLSALI